MPHANGSTGNPRVARACRQALLLCGVLVGIGWLIARFEAQRPLMRLQHLGADIVENEHGSIDRITLPPETTDGTLLLLRDMQDLKYLSLKDTKVSRTGLANLGTLPNLSLLDLSETVEASGSLQEIHRCPALTELRLAGCDWVTDDQIALLGRLPQLTRLDLSGTSISNGAVRHLEQFEALTVLSVVDCPELTDDGVLALAQLPGLAALHLTGTSVSYNGWQQLQAEHPHLLLVFDVDSIPVVRHIIDAGGWFNEQASALVISGPADGFDLSVLSRLSALQALSLVDCNISETNSEWIEDLDQLTFLSLAGSRFPDAMLDPVSRLPLTSLDLGKTDVTDSGIRHLAGMKSLERLVLTETGITDEGLSLLGDLPALQDLDVSGTSITGAGFHGLSRARMLSHLTADCENLNDQSLRYLSSFASLTILNLGKVGEEGIGHLSNVRQLQQLRIDVGPINTNPLVPLQELPDLSNLTLAGSLPPLALRDIARMEHLHHVSFIHADFDEAAVSALRQARPDLSLMMCNQSQQTAP